MRQAALSQEQQGAADELVQIAEVAYREGEVGILELLDAVRTASRARIRNIDLRLRGAPGTDRPGTRSGRHIVALKHLCSILVLSVAVAGLQSVRCARSRTRGTRGAQRDAMDG